MPSRGSCRPSSITNLRDLLLMERTTGPSTTLPPDFLLNLVASVNFMRLSLGRGAHVVLSSAAWQEIRLRFGRDDKGERGALLCIDCWWSELQIPRLRSG
jgi:hypothetical protein